MVERKRRKKNRLRGERSHGKGNTKNRRGAGCRGGRGNAGSNKHKFHSLGRISKKKARLKPKKKSKKTISVGELNEVIETLVKKGKATKKGEMIVVGKETGYNKVLSQGKISKKIVLEISASKKAAEKIIAAGGKAPIKAETKTKEKEKPEA